tara:strand:+ start:308 stop:592 length:285 start_codon:yes stop_codon:yes gene_type:complete
MASLNFDIEDFDIEDTQRLIPSESSIRHAAHHARRKRRKRRPGDPEEVYVDPWANTEHPPELCTCRNFFFFLIVVFIFLVLLFFAMAGVFTRGF